MMRNVKIIICVLGIMIFGCVTVHGSDLAADTVSVPITEESFFSFSPNVTGYWTFYTSPITGRAILHLENEFGHLLAYGDPITIHLVKGAEYVVQAGFWGGPGRYLLNITWSDTFQPHILDYNLLFESHIIPQSHTMPGYGGTIDASGEAEITFVPEESGLWSIYAQSRNDDYNLSDANGGDNPFPMWLEDSFENILAFDNFLSLTEYHSAFSIQLAAGAEYTIKTMMPMWIPVDYSISAVLIENIYDFEPWLDLEYLAAEGFHLDLEAERIPLPGEGGEIFVNGETWFSFVPDATGPWTFYTSDSVGDPLLVITDTVGSFFLGDDDSGYDLNSRFSIYLAEGIEYVLWARFFEDGTGTYTLTVIPFDEYPAVDVTYEAIPGDGGRFELDNLRFLFTPDYSGTWALWIDSNFSYLSISDPSRSFVLESVSWDWDRIPFIFIDLAEGIEYSIIAWASEDTPMQMPTVSIVHEDAFNARRGPVRELPRLIPPPYPVG